MGLAPPGERMSNLGGDWVESAAQRKEDYLDDVGECSDCGERGLELVEGVMNEGMNAPGPSNDDYETPDWLFKAFDAEFGFTLDAAASSKNALCKEFCSLEEANRDGLYAKWFAHRVYINPPYSGIEPFVVRALSAPNLTVLLLPNRTDTGWFRRLVESDRTELRWFRKRIRFCLNGKEADSPRFGSMIAIVKPY